MTTYLLSIGTAVPPAKLEQSTARDFFASQPDLDRLTKRLIGAAFDQSAIDTRYTVIGGGGEHSVTFTSHGDRLRSPTTGERNAIYRNEAPPLSAAAATEALVRSGY